jgi:23S rRNA (adenine2503-C2)-methyltransferase
LTTTEHQKHFLDLEASSWPELLLQWGEKAFRGQQIADWIFKKGAFHPDQMSNLSVALRTKLCEHFDWTLPEIKERLEAQDGTTKLLIAGRKGQLIETVVMRYDGRTTLCVSSQVGCKLACAFCQTGKLGFFRNLSPAEILCQLVLANEILKPENRRVTNVVFMGMGEPLDNYQASVQAANVMMDEKSFGLSARHVTLSTSGIANRIIELAKDSRASLAVSLHAANDPLRTKLMPINRRFNLSQLKESLLYYQEETGRKITIEYILIRNENCSRENAKELVRFLQGMSAKVNLIPFNSHPGLPFQRPTDEEIRSFQKFLADRSIPAPVRYSRGLEASAACGQLAAKNLAELDQSPSRQKAFRKFSDLQSVAPSRRSTQVSVDLA